LEVTRFLPIAISLADALGQVHGRGLIHKDLKPANVLIDDAARIRLTGFGLASRLPREWPAPEPPEVIAGTLAYMAPEQTGRMNRSVDSRSDLYSLGVIFYEMLTGVLPCTAADPMEWVHCHVARQPTPPAERVPEVPEAISGIVMKLLAKTAEERYQTAAGAEADLRRCLSEWKGGGSIEPFPLGERDASDRLLIPEKLYGRYREVRALLDSFERVVASGTPELMLVSGYAGIGKSSVANELHKAIVPPRGLFISGKFDQYKRDIPYATLAQAFRMLIRQLLVKSEEELGVWREAIREAVGPNGQLVVDLIPELELITGKQPHVPELGPREAENRFLAVLGRFLGVFARKEHPLVLFLDDLQWLDAATLKFLEYIITYSDTKYLLAIGAYRDNEVGPAHPLTFTLEAVRKSGAPVHEIVLVPLSVGDLCQLLADTLHCEPNRVEPLARLVHAKTAGNPFFAVHFLTTLYQEQLLDFDDAALAWRWDIGRIREKGYTENVVDFMARRLTALPAATRDTLRIAACLGNRFEIPLLALAHGKSEEETLRDLWEAIREGLILPSRDSYAFAHDRIQQAAYSLIPEGERPAVHLHIGSLLLARIPPEELKEKIFEIVSQLDLGSEIITSWEERERLAELNLIAGKRAKTSTAYASALQYLAAGRALMAEDSWDRRYELTFALELHRAECEFLTGDLTEAEERLAMLTRRAGNIIDAAAVACAQVALYTTLDRSDRAVDACLQYLRRLGVQWSPHPKEKEVSEEYERLWKQLGSRRIEELIDLPTMTEPDWEATLDVLTWASSPALFTDSHLFCLIAGRMVNLSLEHGNSDGSCFGYVRLGMVLGPHFGDYRAGFRFGKLGFDLLEKRGLLRFKARTYLDFGHLINPWTRHLRTGVELLHRGFDAAQETGDLTYACYICNCLITLLLAAGDPLHEVEHEAERALGFVRKARFGLVADIITGQLRLIRTLRGLTPDFSSFNDGSFDEGRFEQHLEGDPRLAIANCWYWIRKLQARFFAGDYASALDAAAKAQRHLWTSPSFFEVAEYHFYAALARAARCDTAPADERPQHLQALVEHHEQLRIWAENCPENFGNRVTLVGAEIARLSGRTEEAMQFYEEAIRSARENGFVQNEGLAHELAARFYRARGFDLIADAYLREARSCYALWGADGKVKQIELHHPRLLEPRTVAPTATFAVRAEQLDLLSVMKASQAVSGEIVLEKLIETLMTIAVEHAGAERALLILPRGEEYRIEAEAATGEKVAIIFRQAPVTTAEVPESVLRYVLRTRESVILNDASAPNLFSDDDYVRRTQPRSVLCLPLTKQAKLAGVLYLENNLMPDAFTPGRVAVLELIASQAAISLKNAGLYAKLQQENAERRRAEEAVRESQRLLQSIMDNSTAVIYLKDLQGCYLLVNRRFEELFHVSRESVIGRTDYDLFPKERADAFRAFDERVFTAGTTLEAEEEVPHDEGVHTYISIKAPICDPEGRPYAVCGISTDITERKQIERMKDEFISTAAHELRTPLTTVMGYLQLLLESGHTFSPQDRREFLELVYRNSEALARIVEDLLDVSLVQAGRLITLERSRQDLAALAERAVAAWRSLNDRHRFILEFPQAPVDLCLDPGKINQVLVNLLSNAVKFSPEGGAIRVSGERRDGEFQVTVEDEGIGMRPEEVARVFDKFYRADASDTALGGLGLGMRIVRSIVEAHGGRIWVESEPGRGTKVHFTLPTDISTRECALPLH
jgi:PAS domain S-box-containing protein